MRLSNMLRWSALALAAVLLGACAGTRGGPIAYDPAGFVQPDAPRAAAIDSSYLISAGDTLTVRVLEANDLSRDYSVDTSGRIAMPLIGSVQAIGLTPNALAANLAAKLNERYLRNPDVTVSIKQSVGRNVTVDGSVRAPGVYPIVGETTLIQAIALARGTGEDANPRRVAVFRRIDGKRMAAAFDLTDIRRGISTDPAIYPGDVVVVDGNRTGPAVRNLIGTLPILALFRPY